MIEEIPLNTPESWQAHELAEILRREFLTDSDASVLIRQEDGRLLLWFSAVSTGMLGTLLATLSHPEELSDPGSLSCRIAIPYDGRGSGAQWKYGMDTTRFSDGSILFTTKIFVPFGDLPEVLTRLSQGS
jgi:hypothetical protein